MLSLEVLNHLRNEMSQADPWRLEGNRFEQSRYSAMREFIEQSLRYRNGLEIGCAAGAFTNFLAGRCDHLQVIDVLPEAVARCRGRLGNSSGVSFTVVDVMDYAAPNGHFDLIVVSEVLYYLGSRRNVAAAIARIKKWLAPRGSVIFGSARDRVSARWGLPCGAETAIKQWSLDLRELRRVAIRGNRPDEDCIVAHFQSRT